MNPKTLLGAAVAMALAAAGLTWLWLRASVPEPQTDSSTQAEITAQSSSVPSLRPAIIAARSANPEPPAEAKIVTTAPEPPPPPLSKLERIEQVRQSFAALAAGDQRAAMLAARQITNAVEREAALMTLVTTWRKGDLSPPQQRALAIAAYGLEAGLGMELVKDPDLARLWADQLTEGKSRSAMLEGLAAEMLDRNPWGALALADQFPAQQRRQFLDSVLGEWAGKDTDAALDWAQQISDQGERDAAIQAIRQVAPVGIGTQLQIQDGLPVVNGLLPGTPAALSGQLHDGDRIVGVAQGDNQFVKANGVALSDLVQMIRGSPGTTVQLQVVSADAALDSTPRTISIVRDQIRHRPVSR